MSECFKRRFLLLAGAFDPVVNLFTSFRYFSSDDENRVVLSKVNGALARDGVFVHDDINSDHVRAIVFARRS